MPKFIIQGPSELKGEIIVQGAKNAALKIIPAAILCNLPTTINNLPEIEDVDKSLALITTLGGIVQKKAGQAIIDPKNIHGANLSPEIAGKFRASIMFVGPLLAKTGQAVFPLPGGCNLASGAHRPIDLFLTGFEKLGAHIKEKEGCYQLTAKKLKGCDFFFPIVSVTATEALMMTATLAEGVTTLKNCAMEPEIKALADYLNEQGAKIEGAGTPNMTITGVKELKGGNITVIPDRLETGSFAIMAAATKSEITIKNCNPDHVMILLSIFDRIGVPYEKGTDWLTVKKAKKILPYSIKTHEYPGFPTDLQSPYTVLMTQAEGSSLIHETIYDRRLLYTDMLMQMGADIIMCDPHRVVVNGPAKLTGKKLASPDLRAGIALVIAGLLADGTTEIDNIYQIDRGYQDLEKRLKAIGADIQRID